MHVKGSGLAAFSGALLLVFGCSTNGTQIAKGALAPAVATFAGLSYTAAAPSVMASNALGGDIGPMHDPSIIRQDGHYYAFTSDYVGQPGGFLLIRCSDDKVQWRSCGAVFQQMPSWTRQGVPGALCLWAPDVSYFGGVYHVYYAVSTSGSQRSIIGLATNTTLDPTDSAYKWVDRGAVLTSHPGDDFNAIDPNILADADGHVWMTYGSYWSGIKQREIDANSGMLASSTVRYDLATRPDTGDDAIEGPSLIRHGGYYYLFVSLDYCCNAAMSTNNYKQAVGRSTSPHGPFVDQQGTLMMNGGATVLIEGNGTWNAPGGGTAWIDPSSGESLLAFHALDMSRQGTPELWLKTLGWQDDWPALN